MDNFAEYAQIYCEIAKGYSIDFFNKNKIYFKHPSLLEHFSIYNNYDVFIESAKKRGLLTEQDKIAEAIKNNWWDSDKESQYQILQKTVENLFKTRDKLLYISQKKELDIQIKKTEGLFLTYAKERKSIVGYTIEQYSNEKFFDELLLSLSYKDEDFKEKYFKNDDEYYDLLDEDVESLRKIYNQKNAKISNENIKEVAATGFIQNLIYLNTEPINFWGKAVVDCSKAQIDLLIYGKMFRKTIESYSESGKPIPDYIVSDPEKLVEWIDNKNGTTPLNKIKSKKTNSNNAVSSYVGATNEDLKNFGAKVEKIKGKSLLQLAREKGGTLEKSDYLNARENS